MPTYPITGKTVLITGAAGGIGAAAARALQARGANVALADLGPGAASALARELGGDRALALTVGCHRHRRTGRRGGPHRRPVRQPRCRLRQRGHRRRSARDDGHHRRGDVRTRRRSGPAGSLAHRARRTAARHRGARARTGHRLGLRLRQRHGQRPLRRRKGRRRTARPGPAHRTRHPRRHRRGALPRLGPHPHRQRSLRQPRHRHPHARDRLPVPARQGHHPRARRRSRRPRHREPLTPHHRSPQVAAGFGAARRPGPRHRPHRRTPPRAAPAPAPAERNPPARPALPRRPAHPGRPP